VQPMGPGCLYPLNNKLELPNILQNLVKYYFSVPVLAKPTVQLEKLGKILLWLGTMLVSTGAVQPGCSQVTPQPQPRLYVQGVKGLLVPGCFAECLPDALEVAGVVHAPEGGGPWWSFRSYKPAILRKSGRVFLGLHAMTIQRMALVDNGMPPQYTVYEYVCLPSHANMQKPIPEY